MNLHFIAFVQKDGLIYEMDGRKISPVEHGKTSNETFLEVKALVFFCLKNFINNIFSIFLFLRMQRKL